MPNAASARRGCAGDDVVGGTARRERRAGPRGHHARVEDAVQLALELVVRLLERIALVLERIALVPDAPLPAHVTKRRGAAFRERRRPRRVASGAGAPAGEDRVETPLHAEVGFRHGEAAAGRARRIPRARGSGPWRAERGL